MYCFYLVNNKTNEETCIYGYNIKNAWSRTKLNPADWTCVNYEYVD